MNEEEAEIVFINSVRSQLVPIVKVDKKRIEQNDSEKSGNFGCGPKADPVSWKEHFPDILIFSNDAEFRSFFQIPEEADEFFLRRIELVFPSLFKMDVTISVPLYYSYCSGKTEDIPLEVILRQILRAESLGVREVVSQEFNYELGMWAF